MYTRHRIFIRSVLDNRRFDFLIRCLIRGEEIGSVRIYVHHDTATKRTPFKEETTHLNIAVDVWGENQGSVDDYCDFFLRKLQTEPSDHWNTIVSVYRDRVANWCRPPVPA